MFGKRGEDNPIQKVVGMRQKGMTDNQILQELQNQGLSTQQIFDAMSNADLAGTGEVPESEQSYAEQPQGEYAEPYPQKEWGAPAYERPSSEPMEGEGRIHEVAEAIISEKWEEVTGEIRKVIAWKERVELDIQKMKDELAALKEEFNQLRQGILGKISEYDTNLRDVSSELKAVHNVFKDVIPSFTENVGELSRLTKNLKKGKEK